MQAKAATAVPGQGRALWMSTIASTVCFAVWTIFAIIGIQIKQQLGLNETQFGLLVGTPILAGWLTRLLFDDAAAAGFGHGDAPLAHRTYQPHSRIDVQ